MYYNYDQLISRNSLFNFVIGERGVGKSYGALKYCVQDYLKRGNEFVYLRRYKSELKSAAPHLFDALLANNEFGEEVELKVNGNDCIINGEVAGHCIALSTSNILKSTSFPKVKTIIFDEFIIDKGSYHYLRNEVTQLLDLYETVARLRDVRIIFLGNAISISNPYFNYFTLSLPYGDSEFKLFKDGMICVNYIKNMEYRAEKKASKFGRLIAGTDYGKYAIDNQWLRDSKYFIGKKGGKAKNICILVVDGNKYGVWYDSDNGCNYVSDDFDPNNPALFAMNYKDHTDQTMLVKARANAWVKILIASYRRGGLMFESQKIKNEVMKLLEKLLTY